MSLEESRLQSAASIISYPPGGRPVGPSPPIAKVLLVVGISGMEAMRKATLVGLLCLLGVVGAVRSQAKPNVLFIVVDDLGVTTSNYGFPARAPNLERLAARGTQFERAYVPWGGAAGTCSS